MRIKCFSKKMPFCIFYLAEEEVLSVLNNLCQSWPLCSFFFGKARSKASLTHFQNLIHAINKFFLMLKTLPTHIRVLFCKLSLV